MKDKVMGPHRLSPLYLRDEGFTRALAQDRVGRGHVDEVIAVDYERKEVTLLAHPRKGRDFLGQKVARVPHPGAARKDLQRIATDPAGMLPCAIERPGNRRMDAYPPGGGRHRPGTAG